MNEFNLCEIKTIYNLLSSNITNSDLVNKVKTLLDIEEFNVKFCTGLSTAINKKELIRRVNSDPDSSIILGEAVSVYKHKLKANKIFTNKELLLITIIKEFFKNKKILEIGTGAGQIAIFLKILGIDVEVCDFISRSQCLFSEMCRQFNVSIVAHRVNFQSIDLSKYDLICAGNIRSPTNNFLKDKNIFQSFVTENKFVILDWTEYSETLEDKDELRAFAENEMFRLLEYIKTTGRIDLAEKLITQYNNIELTQYIS